MRRLAALLLLACSPSPAPVDVPAHTSPPPVATPAPSASASPFGEDPAPIGVPSCDASVAQMRVCLATYDDQEALRGVLARSFAQTVAGWRRSARSGGVSREALEETCRATLEKLRAEPACGR